MAEQTQTVESARQGTRPETSAWLILVTFFLIFCALVAAAGLAGWRYYTNAIVRVDGGLVRVHVRAGVTYQAKGSTKKVTPDVPCADNPPGVTDVCVTLNEGDHVQALPDAGYGQVASVKLPDQTQVDMWAHPTGADLTLQRYAVSRWSKQQQIVEFKQSAGYARYDIPPKERSQYEQVTYSVVISNSESLNLLLSPGGSYSINVPHPEEGHPLALADSGQPLLVEVAVRAGRAEVLTPGGAVMAHPGEKIQVDTAGTLSEALPAQWQLIRNGKLDNWPPGAKTDESGMWIADTIVTDSNTTDEERNGTFSIVRRCGPVTPDNCTDAEYANIGQFSRQGDQSKSFAVLIRQPLDLDVSEYPSLELRAWVRVVNQSIARAGEQGTECPMTIWLKYKQRSPSDREQDRYFCIYVDETAADLPKDQKGSEFIYTPVHQGQWYNLKYVLRNYESLKDTYYLQSITIFANGHDYLSEITDVSLIATQQR